MEVNVFTDGASRGNPGLAGAGSVILVNGEVVDEAFEFLGEKTNNEAEYEALILALRRIIKLVGKRVVSVDSEYTFYADSQLMIKQLRGEYKVKAPKVKPLYEKVCELKDELDCKFVWVRREDNSKADELANRAIDERK